MKWFSSAVIVLIAILAVDGRPGSQHAAQPQVQPPAFVADEVIVKFRPGVDEFSKDMARFRVAGTRKKLFRYIPGLEVIKLHPQVSVEEAIEIYRQDPNVVYAEPNYIVRTTLTPNDPSFGSQWALHNFGQSGGTPDADIDAPEAWERSTGSNEVIVAVIDSGIDYNHADLSANMFRNEADCDSDGVDDDGNGYVNDCHGIDTRNNDSNPMDDNDHGTHVAGTIGAKSNNGAGVAGINWNVKMMACKFVGANGSGPIDGAIECMEYIKTMKDLGHNIVATNNSWGGGGFSQAMYDAIEAHRQRGILFIAAAGNGDPFFGFPINNDQSPFYPCGYYLPNVVCVAATTRTDARSSFSNYGRRTVHIGAPGSDILSTKRNHTYGTSSGTSMATPHVTGVAALLKAENPNRDWRAIKNLLLAGGDTVSSMENTVTQKRLNANNALNCSNRTVFSRLRPIANTIEGSVGEPIDLAALNINCANPNGNVAVTVDLGNETITLLDDGTGSDQAPGDGIFSAQWAPPAEGIYNLTFPGGDVVRVAVITPANIAMSFDGKLRDAVGQGDAALGPDGKADGVFTVTIQAGSGNRTVTSLDLRRSSPSAGWDTEPNTAWVLGAAHTLNGSLLNDPSNGTRVNFEVVDGGSFKIFASDNVGLFTDGATLSLTAKFADGSTATASAPVASPAPPPNLAMSFDGKLRDAVGQGDTALGPDGKVDGVFTVTLQTGSGNRTVTSLELSRSNPTARWDTEPNTAWVLGSALTLTGPLLNNPSDGTRVNFEVVDGGSFKIFASDNVGLFTDGATLSLTAKFADGSTATASAPVASPPTAPSLAMNYNGKLSDRVGKGDKGLAPDGKADGVFTVTLQAGSGNRTVTFLDLRRSNPTAGWDTEPNKVWVLGAAHTLTGGLLNDPNNGTRVSFEVSDGGNFKIFASDNVGLFVDGAIFTLTAKFSDGTTAMASAPVASPATPANLAMNFEGQLSDRVGQGDKGLAPDGKADGVFTVTLQAESGNRTVTFLDLRRSNPTAGWDTEPNKVWVLGAAHTLTGGLLNDPNNGTRVSFEVSDGGSFKIFASDSQKGGLFTDGASFNLTVSFMDGSTATTSAVALLAVTTK